MGISNTTYKQSELGLIPQDWKIYNFDAILKNQNGIKIGPFGSQLKKELLTKNGYKIYGQENVYKNNFEIGDRFLNRAHFEKLKSCEVKPSDFLISMMGTIGKCSIVPNNIEAGIIDSHLIRIRTNHKVIDNKFLLYYFNSHFILSEIKNLSVGGIMDGLSSKIIRQIKIITPQRLDEQTAIANALSDVDNLIESLEKLIQKKKLIKQGALQKLLKPKEGWVNKRLGEIGKVYGGLSGKNKKDFETGDKPYIPFMNVMANTTINTNDLCYVNISSNETQNKVLKSDLIFNGSSETPEEVGMCSVLLHSFPELYLNSFCFGYRLTNTLLHNPLYLSFYFRSSFGRNLIYSLSQGATRYNLSKTNFLNLIIPILPLEEQEEIADILTDMDNEIELLQSKLHKYQEVKQGMMQNLLTGKIRLVNTESKQTKITKPKAESTEKTQGHNKQINEAVIISVLINRYANEKFALSRFRYTKYLYLLHRHIERKAEGFLKKAAGPYNPSNRYGGPEKIALANKYIKTQNNGFVADTNIEQAINYFNEWYDVGHLNWLDAFKFSKNEHLEVLTTVDMAIDELIKENKEPNLTNVKSIITTNKEWKPKLEKPFFNDIEIQKAINESLKLFY